MTILLLRLASIAAVALIATRSNPMVWFVLVYALGFTHYVVSLLYSRSQILESAGFLAHSVVPLCSVLVLGAGLYFLQFSLLFYFAVHHAFNEAYMTRQTLPSQGTAVAQFRGSAVLVHLFVYLCLLRCTPSAGFHDATLYVFSFGQACDQGFGHTGLLMGCLAVAYAVFFHALYRIRALLTRQALIENCGFELIGLLAVGLSFFVRFDFLQIVFYHFVFWSLYPLLRIRSGGTMAVARYAAVTVACLAVFLMMSPYGIPAMRVSAGFYQEQFLLWSFIHITASLVLSRAHPDWILALFRPPPPAETAR